MRKLALAGAIALALFASGCANLQNTWERVTSAQVDPRDVYIAENVFDGLETTAKNFLHYCRLAPPNKGICKNDAITQVIAAVRSGRIARDNLDAFVKLHPDALGAKGLYDALTAATKTLQAVSQQYNLNGVF